MNAATIARTDANHGLANGWRLLLKMHPERGLPVDRELLRNIHETLQAMADSADVRAGRCATLAAVLGELLEPTQ